MPQRYGVNELIRAAVDAHRWRDAAPDLSSYHRTRYDLLREQLDIPFDLLDSGYGTPDERLPSLATTDRDSRHLRRLLTRTIECVTEIPDPFGSYMAGPRAVAAMYQEAGGAVRTARSELESRLKGLATRILEQLIPDIGDRTTSADALLAAGLPTEAPDPLDHW